MLKLLHSKCEESFQNMFNRIQLFYSHVTCHNGDGSRWPLMTSFVCLTKVLTQFLKRGAFLHCSRNSIRNCIRNHIWYKWQIYVRPSFHANHIITFSWSQIITISYVLCQKSNSEGSIFYVLCYRICGDDVNACMSYIVRVIINNIIWGWAFRRSEDTTLTNSGYSRFSAIWICYMWHALPSSSGCGWLYW